MGLLIIVRFDFMYIELDNKFYIFYDTNGSDQNQFDLIHYHF